VNRWPILLRKTVNKSRTKPSWPAYAQNVHNFGLILFTSLDSLNGAPFKALRNYQKIYVLIVHDSTQEPGAVRSGFYFAEEEAANSFWDDFQDNFPDYEADLFGPRWFGWSKKALVAVLNTAYPYSFNYQLFIEGYDGYALETSEGRGMAIFVESPRPEGFNSLSEDISNAPLD